MMLNKFKIVLAIPRFRIYSTIKKQIDFSLLPLLNEHDLEEQQVKGSGPGGQKVNKTSSCIVLKHIPTGLVVKCQETRFLEQNKKKARELLLKKLDNQINGENSIEAQTKKLQDKKRYSNEQKKEKMRQLKEKWKKSVVDTEK
ncbi:mitochondrial translation release factor in rescue [Euwallacea fornicatus]|uniref:mitochondrial translation release factor in rescue n=1 Tax=Euwallacea fornicatus TaxID=995702 RepID=UPI00339009B0